MHLPGVLCWNLEVQDISKLIGEMQDLISAEIDIRAIRNFITETFVPGHFQYASEYQNLVATKIADYLEA